jgi:hypothetical protein
MWHVRNRSVRCRLDRECAVRYRHTVTFKHFAASANRAVRAGVSERPWAVAFSSSAIGAEWASGTRSVYIFPVDSDLANVRFFVNAVMEVQILGWLRTNGSADELGGAIVDYFAGRGHPQE